MSLTDMDGRDDRQISQLIIIRKGIYIDCELCVAEHTECDVVILPSKDVKLICIDCVECLRTLFNVTVKDGTVPEKAV